MRKTLALPAWLILCLPLQALAQASEIQELAPWWLMPGQTRTLPLSSLERFTLSGQALRASPLPGDPNRLLIKALSPGQGDLWVWETPQKLLHLSVTVTERPPAGLPPWAGPAQQLREARVQDSGTRAVLTGTLRSEAELIRVRQLAEGFKDTVEDRTELSDELLELGEGRIRRWLEEEKTGLSLTRQAGQLRVGGAAPDGLTRDLWEQKLRALFAGVRLEILAPSAPAPTVFFRVTLIELRKSSSRELGLDWRSPIGDLGRLGRLSNPELHALEREGSARVLSRPEIVVRVPGEAELFSGGEIPIELRTPRGPSPRLHVEWKPYGLMLKLKLLELAGSKVRLEVSSEVSELDRSNGGPSLPGLQASRMKTQVEAQMGEPLLLSGLFQSRSSRFEEGTPWLARIPLLGTLFGTDSQSSGSSEIVAVLLPLPAPPAAPAAPAPVNPRLEPAGRESSETENDRDLPAGLCR